MADESFPCLKPWKVLNLRVMLPGKILKEWVISSELRKGLSGKRGK